MRLIDGDVVAGTLVDCDQPDRLRWQCDAFTSPFDFVIGGISSVHFPLPGERPTPTGDYRFELAEGDVLFGSLVGLTTEEAEIDLPQLGKVHVRRSALRRMVRWNDGADLAFAGLSGLGNWKVSGDKNDWREEGGHLVTSIDGTSVSADLGIPEQAIIEFEISWTKKPDFVLALGVGNLKKSVEEPYCFEVWDDELVVVRETDDEADVALIGELKAGPGRMHLIAYLDQKRSRLLVHSMDGKRLAELRFSTAQPIILPGVRLTNNRGDVRLERLRISRWNGNLLRAVQAGQARIDKTDGAIIYGQIERFDVAADQFVVSQSGRTSRVRSADVGTIVFARAGNTKKTTLRVVMQNGVRLSGDLVKVDAGRLYLDCPGVKERLALPIADFHALLVLEHDSPSALVRKDRTGHIELSGVRLVGSLVDGKDEAGASCLVWHPLRSSSSSSLRQNASGKIIYRVPPPPPKPRPKTRRQPIRRPAGILGILLGTVDRSRASKPMPAPTPARSLHLRTGDTIPCRVEKIDAAGVTFSTPMSDATFVSHDKVKAVELADTMLFIKVSRTERERLLTLPRMQRNNPPTHLIRSTRGDVLRCRLQAMDDTTLTVEVRLETKQLRRDRVAKIIWLHEDELDRSIPGTPDDSSPTIRVQALRSDGIRLTFVPEQMVDGVLSGTSDVLGACHVDLITVDQLLIGGAIEQAAAGLAYQKWKLHHAVEPKFVTAGNGERERSPGTESALVGQPAPDFNLALLSGSRFHLEAHKGKIIVLDFWATWCGPCIRAMPLVEEAVLAFKDQGVRLVAVNLQETPEQIKSTLERHHLTPAVALDVDGVVAEMYAATAIPQTVVIDRDGKIVRLFVGGGPRIGDQLREALETVLAE